uniref:Uncharacterized protein n=1 Tax=Anguilla anguilla TaxID=7936 RepID=A0A0E9W2F6_ANGAN
MNPLNTLLVLQHCMVMEKKKKKTDLTSSVGLDGIHT